jgi:hypothetical protein
MAPSAIVSDTTPPSQITEVNMENGNETICNIFSLSGQTVVVTGGGRGLGITLAIAAIEAGACVACLDILPEPSPEEWFQLQKLSNKLRLSATVCKLLITTPCMRQLLMLPINTISIIYAM